MGTPGDDTGRTGGGGPPPHRAGSPARTARPRPPAELRPGSPDQPRPPARSDPRPPAPSGPPPRVQLAAPSAVLDEAHLGDIEGALGRVRVSDEQSSGLRRRLVTFLAIMGPGLIVMVGDN